MINDSYPPLAEQQRIVAKLDATFDEINRLLNWRTYAKESTDLRNIL